MLAAAETKFGLYLFVASIVISIICTQILNSIQKSDKQKDLPQVSDNRSISGTSAEKLKTGGFFHQMHK